MQSPSTLLLGDLVIKAFSIPSAMKVGHKSLCFIHEGKNVGEGGKRKFEQRGFSEHSVPFFFFFFFPFTSGLLSSDPVSA